ncbi:MAG: hypothetical protein ACP5M9_03695 [Candidatus Micrarchaeia archaeon]
MAANILTGIDSLLSYINQNGETDVLTLANILGVNESTVLEWSKALEKAKLARITYKLGKMYVSSASNKIVINRSDNSIVTDATNTNQVKGTETLDTNQVKKINEVKTDIIQDNLESQKKNVEIINRKLKESKAFFENAEKMLKEHEPIIKKTIDELNTYNAQARKDTEEIKNYLDQININIEKLKSRSFEFDKEYISFQNVDIVSKNARAVIDDIKSKTSYMRSNINQLINEFDKKTDETRASFVDLKIELRKKEEEINKFEKAINEQISSYNDKLKDYKIDQYAINKEIQKERIALIDKMNLTKSDLEKIYNISMKKFNEINSTVNKDLEKIKNNEARLKDIKNIDYQIKDLEKDIASITQEISDLQNKIKKIKMDKKSNILESYRNVIESEKKSKEINDKMKNINDRLSAVDNETENVADTPKNNM